MKKEFNIRFGVVNVVDRGKYEKKFQVPFGYDLLTYNKIEAMNHAKKKKDVNIVVERIFDTISAVNNKEEVYRSGGNQGRGNEQKNRTNR